MGRESHRARWSIVIDHYIYHGCFYIVYSAKFCSSTGVMLALGTLSASAAALAPGAASDAGAASVSGTVAALFSQSAGVSLSSELSESDSELIVLVRARSAIPSNVVGPAGYAVLPASSSLPLALWCGYTRSFENAR